MTADGEYPCNIRIASYLDVSLFCHGGDIVIFIGLCRLEGKPSKEKTAKVMEYVKKMGPSIKGLYMTLGRYDAVIIFEAPDEKAAMKGSIMMSEFMKTETLVAVSIEEAIKILG